ncbi:erythroblast NAD(P)(+)--arginine ADP-ribosyltransferase-like [Paramisgurnus dabryanus]|uniref:erythroblast NAD(P)(+)--arginine ADP-ribosyltransferase-like n=1 Tax=Paramisgurnus dabryanus TaxID=90735 RepID=UPI0031F37941
MLTTAALILIVTSKVVLGWDGRRADEGKKYSLDMALDSVDDMYDHCESKMRMAVRTTFLFKEMCANVDTFGQVWAYSTGGIPGPDKLKNYHLVAIYIYTDDSIYGKFNRDVRIGRKDYKGKKYTWNSLHFLLTEAIQILKKKQKKCITTYRGTNHTFNENVLNTEIRFGSFTSSSTKKKIAMGFGSESCFEIQTCYGADVSKYSRNPGEKEVLIPPYETFKVTAIVKKDQKKSAWCKTVFMLKSSGYRSDLNCAVVSIKPQIYHNVSLFD